MRKVLFLDIDGVLNTEQQQWKCQMEGIPPADKFGYTFDPKAVSYITPDNQEGKGLEIKEWLEKQQNDIDNYVILDDEDVALPEQQVHFVKCNPQFGINRKVMEAVLRVFG